ncbi:MAG TPA: DUF397 domain-containing protein [Pseudonocardiaceae bacterium]|jgi:hypothetical protein|nr:DUF397 domain-containing protein [Pseudonocardiaceae bacterium]
MHDLTFERWHTSSYSQSNGNSNCVEVGHAATTIGVRDTKNRTAGTLVFPTSVWTAFLTETR